MKLEELADRCRENAAARIVEIGGPARRRAATHAELGALAESRASRLVAAGVLPGHVIGIRAKNSIDWVAWDLAALMTGAVLQAFPDEFALDDADELLARHGLALLITDEAGATAAGAVLSPDASPGENVVPPTARRVDSGDLHSLVYSSGTTGSLKGLNVSKKGTTYVINRFIDGFGVTAEDRHLIFLPLANYQQRLSVYCCLSLGADLVLAPYQQVWGAIRSERPTYVIAPPVFYDTTLQLFRKMGDGESLGDFLGGRIRFLITGMAPIRRETLEAFWAAGIPLLEAYGMTEAGMIAWNTPDANRVGSVGRLLDPDAIEFLPDGELIVRRPAPLSTGYFDTDPDVSAETFRPDGGIATGDYGRLDADGFLTLVGRKKDVIALGSGRKVHPTEIESAFAGIAGIADIVVVPTPSNRLGAIIAPTAPDDQDLRSSIRMRIEEINRTLDGHERIVSTIFVEQPLRADRKFMTANMKLSRTAATAYFAETVTSGHSA